MDLMKRFRSNTFGSNPFILDVIVARLFSTNEQSDLFLIRADGSHHQISEWKAIGNSDFRANKIVSAFWNNEMKMKDFAELSHCIIKFIEYEGLDLSVGVGENNPSIKYLKDGGEIDTEPDNREFSDFENTYNSYKNKFKEILDSNKSVI